jgi:uncharacterized membrane protein HdeD (DUF308 family)
MTLALLLLGPGDLRRSRWFLSALGLSLVAMGGVVALDTWNAVTDICLEAAGWTMVAVGLVRIAFFFLEGSERPWLLLVQGAALVALGFALADFTSESGQAIPWLIGSALCLNGFYETGSAVVIRYPRWGWFAAIGGAHFAVAALLFFRWRQAIDWAVPAALGLGLAFLGVSALRMAVRLDRYLRDATRDLADAAVRYYLDFHAARRFRERSVALSSSALGAPAAGSEAGHGELLVHVWTPLAVAGLNRNPNLVSRYVAAQDKAGKYTVGHSALEMTPDVYISHCDGNPDAFETTDEVWQTLRSKDVPGVFLPTFEEEIAHYMAPTATIPFRRFSASQLRHFWAAYRAVTHYNFTNRNCSVAVAMALEAALLGSLASPRWIRSLLSLLTNKDLWMAHFIRWKAREMVWTPGLMLDYARALARVVEAETEIPWGEENS